MTIFSFREGLEKCYHLWNEEVFMPQLETHDDDVKVLFGELYLYGCFLNLNMNQRKSQDITWCHHQSLGESLPEFHKNLTNPKLLWHCKARLSNRC